VVPATKEVEVGRLWSEAGPEEKHKTLPKAKGKTNKQTKTTGDIAHIVVYWLASMRP
jgi:hypothetical protein